MKILKIPARVWKWASKPFKQNKVSYVNCSERQARYHLIFQILPRKPPPSPPQLPLTTYDIYHYCKKSDKGSPWFYPLEAQNLSLCLLQIMIKIGNIKKQYEWNIYSELSETSMGCNASRIAWEVGHLCNFETTPRTICDTCLRMQETK